VLANEVRLATHEQTEAVGRLLDAFNREYDDPTPGPQALAARIRELTASGDTAVLVASVLDDPGGIADDLVGVAVIRFRPALWSAGAEAYLAELYVLPERRGQGIGRALMVATLELARARGADRIELGTSEDDIAARSLYEAMGFTNRESGSGDHPGPLMYVYERDL
jgi:ribosomal protein S18 acetylase RimI-like enzyme